MNQRRAPHFEQKTSVAPRGLAQPGQKGRGLGARAGSDAASGRMGRIGVPHLVQNFSLGTAPLPQDGQVQPVRRNRASREPAPWPGGAIPAGADGTGGGAAYAGAGGGAIAVAGGGGARSCTRGTSERFASSGPDSRSRLMERIVSRNCCDRSGAVVASALACRLRRSTACSTSRVVASGGRWRYAYQSRSVTDAMEPPRRVPAYSTSRAR